MKGNKTKPKIEETADTPPSVHSVPNIETAPLPPPKPSVSEPEEKHKNLFVLGLIFLVFIILSTGIIAALTYTILPKEKSIKPVELEVKVAKPNEDKETLDKSNFSFEVLNGSGVAGRAGKAAQKLEGLGYTIVEIGNADEQTYTATELSVIKDKFDQAEFLLEDLKTEFPLASLSGELISDSTASARIIIGKE